jgi:hypothetical protein
VAAPVGIALAISVAIHVEAGVAPQLTAAAVRSCEAALGDGQCRLDVALPSDFHASIVASDERLDAAHVEIRKEEGAPPVVTRDFSFAPEDTPRERWASAGVLIAALVVAEARAEPPPPKEPAPPPVEPPRRAPPPPPPEPPRGPSLRIDLRGLVARRLTRGPPEVGAELGASLLFGDGPWLGGIALAGAHRPSEEPSVTWFSVAAGPGLRAGGRDATLAAEFKVGALLEYWRLSASGGGRSESAGELRAGAYAGVDGLWAVHRRWILSLGVEGRFVAPQLKVDISGNEVESVPSLGVLLCAGVRFAP